MDAAIVRWLNDGVGVIPWLDDAINVVVSDYFTPVVLSLLLLGVWFGGKAAASRELHQRAALIAMLGVAFGNLAVQIIGAFTFRDRPFINESLELLFYQPTDSSFPANPAVVGAAIAAGLWGANRRLGAAAFMLTGLWGASRVYAGVSYPTDILAGAAIGVVVVMAVTLVVRRIEPLPTMVIQLAQRFYLA
jgi:undecaprenyl-diphosphatase